MRRVQVSDALRLGRADLMGSSFEKTINVKCMYDERAGLGKKNVYSFISFFFFCLKGSLGMVGPFIVYFLSSSSFFQVDGYLNSIRKS